MEADNGVEIVYSVPIEGTDMWFDQFAIPADAPNPEAAHKFINFILNPENIAVASNFIWYANAVDASIPLLDAEISGDPGIYPEESTMQSLYTVSPYGQRTQRAVTRMWTKIKSGTQKTKSSLLVGGCKLDFARKVEFHAMRIGSHLHSV